MTKSPSEQPKPPQCSIWTLGRLVVAGVLAATAARSARPPRRALRQAVALAPAGRRVACLRALAVVLAGGLPPAPFAALRAASARSGFALARCRPRPRSPVRRASAAPPRLAAPAGAAVLALRAPPVRCGLRCAPVPSGRALPGSGFLAVAFAFGRAPGGSSGRPGGGSPPRGLVLSSGWCAAPSPGGGSRAASRRSGGFVPRPRRVMEFMSPQA